jgi:ketosteroid isomerase-like protein
MLIDNPAEPAIMRLMTSDDRDVETWLQEFETACRARDFDTARGMFADDALAFGTWARAVHGLENVERDQWRNVWPRIREFRFQEQPTIRAGADLAWIAAEWSTEATGADGKAFKRPGRGTFVLARRDGRWRCVHSHFSLLPTQSETAHGRLAGGR